MHFDIPHIATGELLRDHVARRTASAWPSRRISTGANSYPARLCSAWCGRSWSAAAGGFVLDGIPRNMHQARAAYLIGRELGMTADVALRLQVDDRELMRRLLARAALEHRSDDTADIAQPHARVVCDAQQDPGAVGRELQLAILKALP